MSDEDFDTSESYNLDPVSIPVIREITMIAGDAAGDGMGVYFGCNGSGPLTRAKLVELALLADLPLTWLPDPKGNDVQLQRAIQGTKGAAYNAHCVKLKERAEGERAWLSRWVLTSRGIDGTDVGVAYGAIVLRATLYREEDKSVTLAIDSSDPALAAQVTEEYERLIGAEEFAASHVKLWINEVIRDRCDGVKIGPIWYVPPTYRAIADSLTAVFAPVWGDDWMNPPTPVGTSAQLSLGIAFGLQAEVDLVLHGLGEQRKVARANEKTDIGHRGAIGFMAKLRNVGERIAGFADLLGPALVKECQNRIHDAMVELDGIGIFETRSEHKRDE